MTIKRCIVYLVSHKFCSGYCKHIDECDEMGILKFMKIIPIHPEDEPEKDWCWDVEPDEKLYRT